MLATDANDPAAGDFRAVNARIAALAGAKHPVVEAIDLSATAVNAARGKLLARFNGGVGFIHYVGHGGVANWSSWNLLKASDMAAMNNASRPPAVVALSCLVGRYEAPGVDSLGELLLRKAGGGAVAAWGPSGLSRNDPAAALGEAFYRAALEDGCGTLGLAILQARRSLAADPFAGDTRAVYNLLGDPALRIANNLGARSSGNNFAAWRWERFAPADLAHPAVSGATAANFFDYAMDGGYGIEAELPEFGYAMPKGGNESGFVLRWKRRIHRADVAYQLFVSENLEEWIPDPEDVQTVGVEPDPDGVMETVRTRVNRPLAERMYIGVKAVRK